MSNSVFPKRGHIVEGEVFKVEQNYILVSLNAPTEGTIYAEYYNKPAPKDLRKLVKKGDIIKAMVTKVSEGDDSSIILLSRLPLIYEEKFVKLEELYEAGSEFEALVKTVNPKGVVLTYEGYEMFLPNSLLDSELKKKGDKLVNNKLAVVIKEIGRRGNQIRIIATRKPIFDRIRQEQMAERQALREKELDGIQTGAVLEGTVEVIEPHAAFIRFDHITGMLRISQVSHHRIDKIDDVLTKGEKVEVKVIKKEGNRLDLSMKALIPTPFEAFIKEHKVGDEITGKVVSKLPFGVIVELAKDVRGLLHKNEYSWNPKDNFDAYLKIDDDIKVAILSISDKREKISLSKKVLEHNPWDKLNLKNGQVINVRVETVSKDGIYVSYESVDGFIPKNEAHNDPKVNIEDHYQTGDMIDARVYEFSKAEWVLKLSVKRLLNQLEREEFEKYLGEDEAVETLTLGDVLDFDNNDNKK